MAGIKNENAYANTLGLGIGNTQPTALIQLAAGTASSGTAPLKFTSGINLSSPEPGAVEFDGTNLYYTNSLSQRQTLLTNNSGVGSIIGTLNQVLANGTVGSPQTGAVTLTLPQSIATSSDVNFNTVTLASPLLGASGGTGVANTGKTITLGGNLTTSGAFASTFTMTGSTSVTFPTSGTLATTAATVASITGTASQILANGTSGSAQTGAVTLTLPSLTQTNFFSSIGTGGGNFAAFTSSSSTSGTNSANVGYYIRNTDSTTNNWMTLGFFNTSGISSGLIGCQITDQTSTKAADIVFFGSSLGSGLVEGFRLVGSTNSVTLANPLLGASGGTGVNNSGKTITLGGNLTTSGAFASTFTMSNTTAVTFPTSGTLLSTANASGNYVSSATGTANQVIASASTGAVTFSLPQSIATTSNVSFGRVSLANTSSYLIISSSTNSSTSAVTNATNNANALFLNSDSTNNNWMTLGFLNSSSSLSAIIGCQVTNQGSNISDLVFFSGNSGTATETMRISGAGTTTIGRSTPITVNTSGQVTSAFVMRPTASASVYQLDYLSSGSLASNKVVRIGITGATSGFTMEQDGSSVIQYLFSSGNVSMDGNTRLGTNSSSALTLNNVVATTASTTGGGSTLPALAAGYLTVTVNSTTVKIPYYAN